MLHYNIAKGIEINPFENIKFFTIASETNGHDKFSIAMNHLAKSVETRRIGNDWRILFNIELLDFVTMIHWFSIDRGLFMFKNEKIQFQLEEDIMGCW